MNTLFSTILMAPPAGGEEAGQMPSMIFLVLIIVVFYFFMIRPQMRRQKEMKNFRESLQKGDKIVTTGGIYGKITAIKENIISINVGNDVILDVDKNAVLKDGTELGQQK